MPTTENADLTTNVMLRSEETGGHVSITDIEPPPHTAGPPLHTHDFDEVYYVLEGELIFQIEDTLTTKGAGELSLAPRNVPHTLANHGDAPARYVLVCTPAGFRAPLGARRGRGGWGRAAAVGAAADPRDQGRRPADRGARVRPRLAGARSSRRWTWRAPTSTLLPSRRCERLLRRIRDARRTISSSAG
jgi:quercetin dioxygenase-like cupin family protein